MEVHELLPWWKRGAWEQAGCPATLGETVPIDIEWTNEALRSRIKAAIACGDPYGKLTARWLLGRRRFRLAADCMASMASRLVALSIPRPFWMIRVLCDEDPASQAVELQEDEVCDVHVALDVARALEGSDIAFKAAVVDALEQAAELIQRALGVDMRPLADACDAIRAAGYRNEWVWGEEVSPEGIRAQVRVIQDVHSLEVLMDLLDEGGRLMQSECLIRTGPWGSDVWHRHLGDIVWESPWQVSLIDGAGNAHSLVVDEAAWSD